MLCYHCRNAEVCDIFRNLYSASNDFDINQCKNYEDASQYKYKKIAYHDDLMHLMYDYFTGQVDGDYSDEQVRDAIAHAILNL